MEVKEIGSLYIQRVGLMDSEKYVAASRLFCDAGKRVHTPTFVIERIRQGVLLVAHLDGTVIGALTAEILSPTYTEIINDRLPVHSRISSSPPCLELLDAVVEPAYQNIGVASEMTIHGLGLRWGDGRLFKRALAFSRVPVSGETKGTSLGYLKRLGFSELARFEGFYSDTSEFLCPTPACKDGCCCDGVLLIKERAKG